MLYHNILKSKLLKLRPIEPSDLHFLYETENNTDIWFISNTQTPYSKHILAQYIESAAQDIYTIKQLRLMIEEVDTGKTVGAIDLFEFDPNHRRAGIGLLIDKQFRRKGYGKEALSMTLKYSFEVLNLHQLYCNIPQNNEPSIQLFNELGFRQIGTKKEWLRTPNGWLDELMFQKLNQTNTL